MINYRSCVINRGDDFLNINIDYDIQFETPHNETYVIEPPSELVEIISESFNPCEFDFYSVHFERIKLDKVTRITDYKGIRGLLSLPVETLSGSCTSATHKVYFGVNRADEVTLSPKCSIVICSPKSECLTAHDAFSLIDKLTADAFGSIDTLSRDIHRQDANLFIVNWYLENTIKLSVYGNINKAFSSEKLSRLNNAIIENNGVK